MDIRKLARAMLAWMRPPSRRSPHLDRVRIGRALKTRLSPHLVKDIGGEEG
jgi:hypothetical protein